jgi:hypothetical protein
VVKSKIAPAKSTVEKLSGLHGEFKKKTKCEDTAAALLVLAHVIQDKEFVDMSEVKSALEYTFATEALRVDVGGEVRTGPILPRED